MESLEEIKIFGDSYSPDPKQYRAASRGIRVRENRILLTYETNTDQWFIPGGGLEENETPEACCIREMGEETGRGMRILRPFAAVEEHYGDWLFLHRYYLCEDAGPVPQKLTQEEKTNGLEPRWLLVSEAVGLFSGYRDIKNDLLKYGTYLREYTVLSRYIRQTNSK